MIDAGGRAGDFPVVGRTVEVYYMKTGFEEVDARDEGLSLNAITVEVIRVTIGGCDKDYSMGH